MPMNIGLCAGLPMSCRRFGGRIHCAQALVSYAWALMRENPTWPKKRTPARARPRKIRRYRGQEFEAALEELEEIVRKLESGEIDLDGAIQAYARGAALKRHCDQKLRQAEQRVSRINVADDGTVSATPIDLEGGAGR